MVKKRGGMDVHGFLSLLLLRGPANQARVDKQIAAQARRAAVLVADSSGFTRRSQQYGIIKALSLVVQRYYQARGLFKKHGALLYRPEVDNVLAVFKDASSAVQAAVAFQREMARLNEGKEDADRLHVCIGVHVGEVFLFSDDVYGDAVNIASKVGEDLAAKDEILLTAEAVQDCGVKAERVRSVVLSGRPLELFQVAW